MEAEYSQERESVKFSYCGGHIWYYDDQIDGKFEECGSTDLLGEDEYCHKAELTCEYFIASPTADEILEKLPCATQQEWFVISVDPGNKEWVIEWHNRGYLYRGESLADAAAKMWLYLKKENLI